VSLSFQRAVAGLAERADHENMNAVAAAAAHADVVDLARLTSVLADSGDRLIEPAPDVVDIASSGGPGSLSTLLAPLYACALGMRVAKVGVPGRPAGGLDVLASLPGYNPDVDAPTARGILDRCAYVHVAAGSAFCPLDAAFFSWRQKNGAQAIPNLAITSLLAKKRAAGVGRFVLDTRVGPHGNLGTTGDEARSNARRLIEVAAELGIQAICVLTAGQSAPQPWIGRGEALVALSDVLYGAAEGQLLRHADACLRMADLAAGLSDTTASSNLGAQAVAVHETMLVAHGSTVPAFRDRTRVIGDAPRHSVIAGRSGWLQVDLAGVRQVLVDRQRAADPVAGARFPDPGGVHLAVPHGAKVVSGAVVARVRDDDDPVLLGHQLAPHLRVVDEPTDDVIDAPMEVVRG
jgi:pyrimidine-nucleoside phosphorylase